MTDRRILLGGTLALALIPLTACSKTEDKAPETKIFGRPPVIEQVVPFTTTQVTVSCDFTNAFNYSLPILLGSNVQIAGPLLIGGIYTQINMEVKVSDPDSPADPTKTDILLVSASFIPDPLVKTPEEVTLVLFDDGGTLKFDYPQSGSVYEDCSTSPTGQIVCRQAIRIPLTSNDKTQYDGTYTRHFALVNLTLQGPGAALFRDCVASANHQYPYSSPPLRQLSFRVDAVDREGNLTTFPQRQTITSQKSDFTCSGDPCLCCYLRLGVQDVTSPDGQCRGLPGLTGPDQPEGFCNSVSPTP